MPYRVLMKTSRRRQQLAPCHRDGSTDDLKFVRLVDLFCRLTVNGTESDCKSD